MMKNINKMIGIALTGIFFMSMLYGSQASACSSPCNGQNPHHYPPMLGDTNPYKYNDGIVVNGNNYTVVNHQIPINQVLTVGKQTTVQLNVFDVRQTSEIKHIGLYIAPKGVTTPDGTMPNVVWDSSTGVTKNTGKGTFSEMTGGLVIADSNHGQARFAFNPAKALGDSNIIVRMWDIRGVSEDHVLTGVKIGGTAPVDTSFNPCDLIVKKKGWKPTPECLAYELA